MTVKNVNFQQWTEIATKNNPRGTRYDIQIGGVTARRKASRAEMLQVFKACPEVGDSDLTITAWLPSGENIRL